MARLQSGEQHLVDRSDDEVRQLRFLAARQPRMGHDRVLGMMLRVNSEILVTSDLGQPARTEEALEQAIEPRLPVAQGDRAYRLVVLAHGVKPLNHTIEHGITCCLGREGNLQPASAPTPRHDLRCCERRFRLALAHRRFDDHEARLRHCPYCFAGRTLHGTRFGTLGKLKPRREQAVNRIGDVDRLPRWQQRKPIQRPTARGPHFPTLLEVALPGMATASHYLRSSPR